MEDKRMTEPSTENLGNIREWISEVEGRVGFLENSLPFEKKEELIVLPPEAEWSRRQWSYVKQLEARVLHCENKLMEHMASGKRKSKYV